MNRSLGPFIMSAWYVTALIMGRFTSTWDIISITGVGIVMAILTGGTLAVDLEDRRKQPRK